jgi:hypothetical protein
LSPLHARRKLACRYVQSRAWYAIGAHFAATARSGSADPERGGRNLRPVM